MLKSNLKFESVIHLWWLYTRVKIEQMLVESEMFGRKEFELGFESENEMVVTWYHFPTNFWQFKLLKMLHPI